ncbi:MAG TPA: hypothetical protein PK745_11380, partial [bacterium]|nr:hypothetical protein [bacterium]
PAYSRSIATGQPFTIQLSSSKKKPAQAGFFVLNLLRLSFVKSNVATFFPVFAVYIGNPS